jgi:Response regulator of the LytR/AlgR family
MINIGICDDDDVELIIIETKLRSIAKIMTEEKVEIQTYSTSHEILDKITDEPGFFNMLFLDLNIDEKTGFEIAGAVRSQMHPCAVVFITAFADLMVEGFRYLASDYLVKPVDELKLKRAFETALSHLTTQALHISVKEKELVIPYSSIMFFENSLKKTYIFRYNEDKPIEIAKSISNLPKLPEDSFYMCHKSFLVNFFYVNEIDKAKHEIVLINGHRIKISRAFYPMIMQKFIAYHSLKREIIFQ